MAFWWDDVLAFTALEQVGSLLASPIPAWVWSREGGRFLWANVPAGRTTGVVRLQTLVQRQWPSAHPLRRSLNGLAGGQPAAGSASGGVLARLRIGNDGSDVPLTCRVSTCRARDVRALLIVAESERNPPDFDDLAVFLSAPGVQAHIEDPSGRAVASGHHGVGGDARTTRATPFKSGAQIFRLRFLADHAAMAEAARPPPEPPILRSAAAAGPISDAPSGGAPRPERSDSSSDLDIVELQAAVVGAAAERIAADEVRRDRRRNDPRRLDAHRDPIPVPQQPTAAARTAVPAAANDGGEPRAVTVGRSAQPLPRQPVRFLWQTDGAGRFLFVSPGLAQIVGRNADVIGETWPDIASRLKLDPEGRIDNVLAGDGTWSGLTAWWPVEGSNVRVPVELTALPIFGADRSFQGFRGFGILKPAEALMPAAFDVRFRGAPGSTEPTPPYEESASTAGNVVPLRGDLAPDPQRLSDQERSAFEEIAAALRDRIVEPRGTRAAPAEPAQAEINGEPRDAVPARVPLDKAPARSPRGADHPPSSPRLGSAAPRSRRDPPASSPEPAKPVPDDSARSVVRPDATRETRASSAAESDHTPREAAAPRDVSRSAAAVDLVAEGVLFLDREGDIEGVSRAAESILGLTASEMRGTPAADLFALEGAAALLGDMAALRSATGAGAGRRTRIVDAAIGESLVPLEVTLGLLPSGPGFCVVIRDLSAMKRLEADLAEAREAADLATRQRSEFLFQAAQEIRAPLDALIGLAEIASKSAFADDDGLATMLGEMHAAAASIGHVVDGLLDLTRIETGKLDVAFGAVSLNDLVRESIGLMQPQAGKARVVLRSSTAREVPPVVADQRMLQRAILNLLSNSIRLTGPGGQVIASTSLLESGEALLRVRDTGDGPSGSADGRALAAGWRNGGHPDAARTDARPGLSMTKALVEANRASMTMRSTPGEGTVVTVAFPPTRVLSE